MEHQKRPYTDPNRKSYDTRRSFLKKTTIAAFATTSIAQNLSACSLTRPANQSHSLKSRLLKSIKYGMINGKSVMERFQMAKDAGFEAIELNTPNAPTKEAIAAIAATGIIVDGSVCSTHWKIRHSDPDPKIRDKALAHLKQSITETHQVGGSSILIVVGHGKDGTQQEVWDRSTENIKQAIPLAAKLGINILIENVWNHFCYNHQGNSNQTAEQLAKYVDQFNSPLVGLQFDIGNHWKYGNTADWIRHLGQRIYKLDVKGFSRKTNNFTNIGDGDINFTDIRKALIEINYHGWCAAEVRGGKSERLKAISQNMDKVFAL